MLAFNLPFGLYLLLLIATFWLYIYAVLIKLNACNILLSQGEQEMSCALKYIIRQLGYYIKSFKII